MSFIVDLDKDTCGSDVLDAMIPSQNVIYKISKDNPYLEVIKEKFKIEIIKDEGDKIYFRVYSSG